MRKTSPDLPATTLELKGLYLLLERMNETLQSIGEQIILIHADNTEILSLLTGEDSDWDRDDSDRDHI